MTKLLLWILQVNVEENQTWDGASVSATSRWETELVLWHKKNLCALQHFSTWISACQRGYNICKHNVYLLRAQSEKAESAHQAGNIHFAALKWKKPSLSGLLSPCVVPLVMADGWSHGALRGAQISQWQTQACWFYPSWARSTQGLHSQTLSLGCIHPIPSSGWALLPEKYGVLINQNMPAEFVPWFLGSEKN